MTKGLLHLHFIGLCNINSNLLSSPYLTFAHSGCHPVCGGRENLQKTLATYNYITTFGSHKSLICVQSPLYSSFHHLNCHVFPFSAVHSCSDIHQKFPTLPSSDYHIQWPGVVGVYHVWCDMDTQGGGWTVSTL